MLQPDCGLSEEEECRYRELIDKRRAVRLTPTEHQELLRLTDIVEELQAQQVHHLAELARRGGTSLSALMEELGLQPLPDA